MKLKFLILTFIIFTLLIKVKAQQATIGIGPEVSLPSGNSSNLSSVGFGGFLKGEIYISEKFAFTAQGSLVSFLGKKFFGTKTPTISYVPVKVGLKYYTSIDFYFEGQAGASLPINGKTSTSFAWSPGLGTYIHKRGGNDKFDVGLRYESWTRSKFNFITFRVGYLFGL